MKASEKPAEVGNKLSLPSASGFLLILSFYPEDGQAQTFFLFSTIFLLPCSSEFVASPPSFHLVIRALV
jgi:hypothetical protein